MNKKRIFATAMLTTAAVMQLMTTALAAETSNSATNNASNNYNKSAHTTFGVYESDTKDVSGQVSFEVPLYVTMAATPERDKMLVPTKGDYYIENTSKDIVDPSTGATKKVIETNPIGVTNIAVQGRKSTWEVVENGTVLTDNTGDEHKMTFTLGDINIPKIAKGSDAEVFLYKNSKNDKKKPTQTDGTWAGLQTGNTFVSLNTWDASADKDGSDMRNALVKIGRGDDKLKIDMDSTIAKMAKRTKKSTTEVLKVKYTLAALDANGQPKTAAVYVGDDWVDAMYDADPAK